MSYIFTKTKPDDSAKHLTKREYMAIIFMQAIIQAHADDKEYLAYSAAEDAVITADRFVLELNGEKLEGDPKIASKVVKAKV